MGEVPLYVWRLLEKKEAHRPWGVLRRLHVLLDIKYRGTSLIRNCYPLEPYRTTMPRVLWWP